MADTLVLIHGYSDQGKSFTNWRNLLRDRYERTEQICICDYVSLTNEVTIKDLAEGFDLALKQRAGLDKNEDFDAIVHSTGMLVIRAWLTTYPARRDRLKHLIGLAPATFGSPLARKGRSWIGAVFKGNKDLGPDFLAAGDLILDGLEIASPFTWSLAEKDLLPRAGEPPWYDDKTATPYVHIFCGTDAYSGLRKFVNEPGTDGTVRQTGAGFNARKIVVDLTKQMSVLNPERKAGVKRWRLDNWSYPHIPVHLIKDLNHGTILTDPTPELVKLVRDALDVDSRPSFLEWLKQADAHGRMERQAEQWVQFIVRARDERGDPITDYNLQLLGDADDPDSRIDAFDENVAVYSGDASYRCFLVDATRFNAGESLWLGIRASSGSEYVSYNGHDFVLDDPEAGRITSGRNFDAKLDLSGFMTVSEKRSFVSPFTTTLVELFMDREPGGKLVQLDRETSE